MTKKIDRRKFNKGHKGVSGRKPKSAEMALVDQLSIYDTLAQHKLIELINGGNMKALQLFYAYRYGKPKETKDIKVINEQPLFEISYDDIVEDIIEDTDE